ncbi:MAG: DUF4364 domain-containing protein [Firmicutes bacterium HGW-Firmicutes-7]|nr:MAG: DUF4364 domain-containing protein [Firmicutes bacterium HGW-Firmicutes-7]
MNATNQELSLNKLIILYMLNILDSPLTNSKISEFILNNGYTSYFSLQEYLNQMTESDLLKTTNASHTTMYYITESGKTTLEFFENRIPDSTKAEIVKYLDDNKFEIKSTLEISAEYYPGKKDDILVHCLAKENKEIIMELKVTVYEKDYAIKICDNWKVNNHEIYKNLLSDLIK